MTQVRERILSGQLGAGDRLPPERVMAEQFDVSRNTLREALRMLEVAGLIDRRRGATGGAFVIEPGPTAAGEGSGATDLSRYSLTDLREARSEFASIVVRLACERADDAALNRLSANVDASTALISAGDRRQRALINLEFHHLLAEATGNPVLVEMMRPVMDIMREVVLALGPTEGDAVVRSRRRILEHLRARDANKALAEMNAHLDRMHTLWVDANYAGAGPARP